MDFLTLCQDTWRECGLSGDGPADVEKVTSLHRRVRDWVNDAYLQICQMHHNWSFLIHTERPEFVVGQPVYTYKQLGVEDLNTLIRIFVKDPGEEDRLFDDYDTMSPLTVGGVFKFTGQKPGKPSRFTLVPGPEPQFLFNKVPDEKYPLAIMYYRDAQPLVDNFEEPLIPKPYRKAIVWKAKEFYGMYDEADVDISDAKQNFSQVLVRMESKFLPPMRWAENAFTGT